MKELRPSAEKVSFPNWQLWVGGTFQGQADKLKTEIITLFNIFLYLKQKTTTNSWDTVYKVDKNNIATDISSEFTDSVFMVCP